MKEYPSLAQVLTSRFGAWIVGSAANPDNPKPRDYDVVIPFHEWAKASLIIPPDAKPNTFRGWKCISDGAEVDVWPDDVASLMLHPKSKYAYHPMTGTRIMKVPA